MVASLSVRLVALGLILIGGTAAEAADPGKTLNIFIWSDYIAPTVIPEFERQTGIHVVYDTYDSNDILEGKLAPGGSGYDLVVPTLTPFLARQIKAGFYLKLDKSKLPNWSHLDPVLLERMAKYDPGNEYAIPWTSGTNGIGYNVDKARAVLPGQAIDSLKDFFDPAIAAKFKDCGISMIDSPTEIYPSVLHYLGLDPDTQKKEDYERANDVLMKLRPYIRKFDSSGYINDLANGDLCLVWGYSSDVRIAERRADEAKNGVHVRYVIPADGTQQWIDTMAIPKDAPHVEAALAFMNFILDPKIMALTSNAIFIRTGNRDALPLVAREVADDPNIFPPPEVEAKLFTASPSTPAIDRLRTRLWEQVKAAR